MAQNPVDISGIIKEGQKPAIAVPDFRGAGDAQKFMNTFNQTLWDELDGAGVLKLVGKSLLSAECAAAASRISCRPTPAGQSNGTWLTDWSGAPVNANYLAFGYTGVPGGPLGAVRMALQSEPADARRRDVVPGNRYFGSLDEDGAKKVAREFAADILEQFGGKSLSGTKIYFVSDRTGPNILPNGRKMA